ncbi:MAG: Nascent polypeptide-associated complex protein [Candidatus Lokiarchaeota archaeon]|nr:Nascent polypeptide-associated complex protein [Candidatus Lokiarchaeota archaeon]
MVKLPKELQTKEKNKPKRPQAVKRREGSNLASRQMRRKMQQQGIEMDQIDATRVIIEGEERTLVINQPEVILMKQMGQEIYQIIGEAEEFSSEEIIFEEKKEILETEEDFSSETKPMITENDIMLVAAQANVNIDVAKAALIDCEGDIAKAILFLKNRP